MLDAEEGRITEKPCDTCGGKVFHLVDAAHPILDGPLVRCLRCGLVQVNPAGRRYLVDDFGDATARAAAYRRQADTVLASLQYRPELERDERDVRDCFWGERLRRIERVARPGRLLDVGSDGQFLRLARARGWAVEGVQPHAATCAEARRRFGVDLRPTTLDEAGYDDGAFDVVTIFHVIEHLPSPAALCREVLRVLKPGGLFVVETPNIDTLWFRVLGRRWRQFIPDHYWFYSPASLRRLLDGVGYRVERVDRVGKAVSVRLLANRLERMVHTRLTVLERMLAVFGLDRRVLWINPGDIMLAMARRPAAAPGTMAVTP